MSSQELEELQIKINKELNNRRLSTQNEEIERIKLIYIGKYIKYVTEKSFYVGYVKDIITTDGGYELTCTGFVLDTYGSISINLNVDSCFYIFCNIENFAKVQCITKDEMKVIFKEYIGKLNEYFKDKVFNDSSN